ncbi:LysR family transcriptional regulator [Skermanella aerolata]|jgi:DNA-binding transcriptional LysR family regulator|uniref:LysR family transcriptional regulator n=1 Tax=Skermanella aerolata TaxID=393310 RepID=A0A512DSQ9_9PROT|nr:LysR family transcriptional regulator [Skermanella aerolata]KJB96056.1 LysR family transcriptional regulator [Skermanella aerolata KACC 11604]GEO39504.1 LysR family transcriptional regulator [Skermanella aerolata]
METEELAVLVQAVAAGSLSAAARRLNLTPTIASRRLAALEERLGVRLMHRTTRSVSLTPEGETFLPHAQAMLEAEAAARASLAPVGPGVGGLLRVTAPAAFGRKVVAPIIPDLLAVNPELRIDLELTDSVVDIAAAGIDVAIRIGRLRDSTLIARRLSSNPRVLCAAPAYLARAGTPKTAEDLTRCECLVLSGTATWPFGGGNDAREVRISGRFASNSIEAIREACLGGLGLALLSRWDVVEELKSGTLVPVELDALAPQEISIWAVYPSPRLVAPKVRAFIAALERALGELST